MTDLSLEIVEGPGAGRLVPLAGPLELGSDAAAGLRLEDRHVSPRHARVIPEGGGAVVEDLGDPGGTFVNDAEVRAGTRIRPGDEIQLGVTVLQLRSAADVAAGPTAVRPKPPPLAAEPREPGYVPAEVAAQDPVTPELDALLDVRTKAKARTAPLAIFVIVVFAVLIFLALTKL
ncbi:MAG: FHA domain-containing protein [Gaiellaceae bacterium]